MSSDMKLKKRQFYKDVYLSKYADNDMPDDEPTTKTKRPPADLKGIDEPTYEDSVTEPSLSGYTDSSPDESWSDPREGEAAYAQIYDIVEPIAKDFYEKELHALMPEVEVYGYSDSIKSLIDNYVNNLSGEVSKALKTLIFYKMNDYLQQYAPERTQFMAKQRKQKPKPSGPSFPKLWRS